MRKLLKLVLAMTCALSLSLFGCNGGSNSGGGNTGSNGGDEGLKIVIVTSPSGVDDASFNQNNYEGIKAFIAMNEGATVVDVREIDRDKSIAAVEAVVADYDVIVTPGFQFSEIYAIAEANPEKYFILVDAFPTLDGEEMKADNIYAMMFAEQESGFFAGITAAMMTETGKVASVHGIAYPSNVNYQYGFESGVNYAKIGRAHV